MNKPTHTPGVMSLYPPDHPAATDQNHLWRLCLMIDGKIVIHMTDCSHHGATPEETDLAREMTRRWNTQPALLAACLALALAQGIDDPELKAEAVFNAMGMALAAIAATEPAK